MSAFETAFHILLGHEGGYVNHPRDPGGETKWGISKRSYPKVDIKNLTAEGAKEIYKRDYWDDCECTAIAAASPALALLVFDAAVNCGGRRSAKWLQVSIGAKPDGAVGPQTIAALQAAIQRKGLATVCRDILVTRLLYHVALSTWRDFGLGWARRIIGLAFQTLRMEQEVKSNGV